MGGRELTRLSGQRGVTLLELLVVMTILALMAGVVVINTPAARSDAEEEAMRFAARMRTAWEDAVVSGAVFSFELGEAAYAVKTYTSGEWQADSGRGRFSERNVSSGVKMTVTLEDPARANESETRAGARDEPLRIILDPIGLTTPFEVEFADRKARWRVFNADDESIVVMRDGA